MAKTASFNLAAALKASRGLRKEAAENPVASGFEVFDDGKYLLRGKSFSIGQSQAGRLQACFEFTFLDGDYRGKTFRHYQGLDTANGWGYLQADLARMDMGDGIDLDTEKGVLTLAKQFAKERPIVWGRLRTKGEFQNLRIDRLATDEDPDDYDTVTSTDDEDDTPTTKKPASKKPAKKAKTEDEDDDDAIAEEDADDSDDTADDSDDSDDSEDADDSDDEEVVEEDDDDDDDTIAVSIGATVVVKTSDGKKTGEVLEIFEKDNKLKVKTTDGKTYKLSADRVLNVKELPKKAAPKAAPKATAKKKR